MFSKRALSLLILLFLIISATAYFQSQTAPNFEADFAMFTRDELKWLEDNPKILYAPDSDFYPYEYLENGTYLGFSLDYVTWINDHYNLGIEVVPFPTWDDTLIALKNKEIDLITSKARSAKRDEYILFTAPYTSMDYLAFIHKDTNDDFYNYDLPRLKTAVIKNYITQDILEERYPQMDLILVDNSNHGFELLDNKDIDVFIASAGQAIKSIEDLKLTNVKANERVRILSSAPLHMGTHTDNPQLATILTKILKNMPQHEKDRIFKKWMHIEFANTFTNTQYKRTLIVGVAISAFIVMIFIWNQLLKYRVEAKSNDIKKELQQRKLLEARLKNIINAIPSPIYVQDENGLFLHVNQAFCDIIGVASPKHLEANDQTIPQVFAEDSVNYFNEMNDYVLRTEEAYSDKKNEVHFKNGSSLILSSLKMPFTLLESSKKGILSVDIDISQGEALRKQLERANQILEASVDERTRAIQKLNLDLSSAMEKIKSNEGALQDANDELNSLLDTLKATQQELISKETMGTQGLRLSQIAKEISSPILDIKNKNTHLLHTLTRLLHDIRDKQVDYEAFSTSITEMDKNLDAIRIKLTECASIVETFKLISIVDHGLQPTRINLNLMLDTCYTQVLLFKPLENLVCPQDLYLHASPNAFHQIILHILKFIVGTGPSKKQVDVKIHVHHDPHELQIRFTRNLTDIHLNEAYKLSGLGIEIIESILKHYFSGSLTKTVSNKSVEVIMTIPSLVIVSSDQDTQAYKGGMDHV